MLENFWNLNTLWFFLIAVLWIGFFFLEGFDFGVGILLRFVGKTDADRRVMLRTIGPVWDGNEVWMIVAGGATFAAFPEWYATLFSGFYPALFILLAALIFRGVGIEFRGKDSGRPGWRRVWDEAIFWGSAVPALLFGVAFASMLRGVPIDANKEFVGSLLDLLQPYALLAGVTTLLLFTLHGALFVALKTEDVVRVRSWSVAELLSWPVAVLVFAFLAWTYVNALAAEHTGVVPGVVPIAALGASVAAPLLVREHREGWAFAATGTTIILITATIFLNLYPRVLVSSLDPAWSLTIYNAASTPYTLTVMSVVAAIFTPIVLVYQGWTYWVFRRRISHSDLEPPLEPAKQVSAPSANGGNVSAVR